MKRPMAIVGFTYIASLLALANVSEKYMVYILIFMCLFCAFSFLIPKFRKNKSFLFCLGSCLLASVVSFINLKLNVEPIQKYENTESVVSCVIDDMPYSKNDRFYYQAKVEGVNGENVKPFKALISSSSPLECNFGDTILCKVQFYKPSTTYAFDSRSYLKSKGIYICATCDPNYETEAYSPDKRGLKYYIINLRYNMLDVAKRFLSEDIASVQNSIFLGEKNNIPNHIKNDFLKNGMYHLQVTSGIHISIIMMACLWLFKKLKFSSKAAHLLTILPVLGFMVLSGMGDSSLRAAIMCVVYLLGISFAKKPDTINSIGLAVFLICLINPQSALNLGLWLSMLSVLGIALFYQPITIWVNVHLNKKIRNNPFIKLIISSIIVSISVNISSAPLAIVYSKIFSLSQFFLSIIVIPISTIIIISSLVLAFLGVLQLPNLALYPFAFISGIHTKLLVDISSFCAKIPFAYVSLDYPFLKLWFGITIIVAAVCLQLAGRKRRALIACAISVLTLLGGIFSHQILNFNSSKISVINCSEGVALLITKNNHTSCVLCTGQNNNTKNFENALELSNIYDIDYFAITNPDNCSPYFLNNVTNDYNIKCLVLPSEENDNISNPVGKPIYFDQNITSSLWDNNLTIDITQTDDYIYSNIQIDGINIALLCGDKTTKLPAECGDIDILITNSAPKNIEDINYKSLMIYGTQYNISKIISPLPPNTQIYNLWYFGKLDLLIKDNKYKVGA